jgi:ribonuclease D
VRVSATLAAPVTASSNEPPSARTHAVVAPVQIDPARILFVDSARSLEILLAALDEADDEIPLDTEADSFHHYFEKVCLIQVAVGTRAFLVDPLVPGLDLSPLLERLGRRLLLLHGADYDIRLLHRGHAFAAAAIFDTMIAAQLLGEKEIGLAALLARRVGVALDKTNQRDDWSARPLSPAQTTYAAADVVFLRALVDSMRSDLDRLGRLEWHREECERLLKMPLDGREKDPENDWRIKGTNAMNGRERAFVRALWEVREARARGLDRPPFRVLTNERLLSAARAGARGETSVDALFPGRPLPPPLVAALDGALRSAGALLPASWPAARRGETFSPDPALEKEVSRLKTRRDALAASLSLDPGFLASRALLTGAARLVLRNGRLDRDSLVSEAGFSRWRAELLAQG